MTMAKVYYDNDADMKVLEGKTVAVLGYGSQGHAHAQNLRDSGVNVVVGLYEGSRSALKAKADGFEVLSVGDATSKSDVVMFLMPDHLQGKVFNESVKPDLKEGMALAFAHGFSVHFGQVVPPAGVDVFMISPKSPGHLVRSMFKEGKGVPALVAVGENASGKAMDIALAYGRGIGAGRAGILETNFREETETDLFGEQVVLCGGITELMKAGFEVLTEAGYDPQIAYFECLNEMKLIVDLMFEGGISWMRYSVSDTANFGDMCVGSRIIDEDARDKMRNVLQEVQNGAFARKWISENENGRPGLGKWMKTEQEHPIEKVGSQLREMMPWLDAKKVPSA
jgi:ketol-acid reductoisomerase